MSKLLHFNTTLSFQNNSSLKRHDFSRVNQHKNHVKSQISRILTRKDSLFFSDQTPTATCMTKGRIICEEFFLSTSVLLQLTLCSKWSRTHGPIDKDLNPKYSFWFVRSCTSYICPASSSRAFDPLTVL